MNDYPYSVAPYDTVPARLLSSVKANQNTLSIKEAKELKATAEEAIGKIISDYERATGCLVCDVGFWHNEFSRVIERVDMRIELR